MTLIKYYVLINWLNQRKTMRKSFQNTIAIGSAIAGMSIAVPNCVSIAANAVAPYDDGRILTNSAVAHVLGIDVAYDPKKDPNYKPSKLGESYRENLFTDQFTYVRDTAISAHNEWHKPDTLKENIAVKFGPITVGGISGIISAAAMAVYFGLKKKKAQ
ncbi:hypothetical protein ACFL2V_11330 [Pseudomonadota bacterium]